jgi:uncharacterized membrane protein YkoI
MKSSRTRNLIIGGVAVVAIAAGGGAYAIADGSKEKEQEKTLTTTETQKAEAAAAREVDGQVLYVEYEEDYGGGYEVEMQLKDGSEAEVYLDKSFKVAGVEREEGEKGEEMEDQGEYGAEDAGYGPVEEGAQGQK